MATEAADTIISFSREPRDGAEEWGAFTGASALPEAPLVIVAVPAYNEEVAIGSVVLRASKHADRVVVVDDGSEDRTAEVARLAGAEVISHGTNQGKGAGIRDAFAYARENNAGILVVIDGDGQHDPDEIPRLLAPILEGEADMVNGSRFLAKGGHHVPKYRRVGQEVLNAATYTGSRVRITDSQNGFRAYSRRAFDGFSFSELGMAIESEMLIDAAGRNLRIMEVPIDVRYDVEGSTYNPVAHGLSVLGGIIRLVSQKRPLLFISLPGLAVLLAGMFFLVRVLEIFNATRNIAVGSAIIGSLGTIVGMLGIFMGLTLMSIQGLSRKI